MAQWNVRALRFNPAMRLFRRRPNNIYNPKDEQSNLPTDPRYLAIRGGYLIDIRPGSESNDWDLGEGPDALPQPINESDG